MSYHDELSLNDDDLVENIQGRGTVVFSHEWDSGDPGAGAGVERVIQWNDGFYLISMDFGNHGPFPAFEDVIAAFELLTATGATTAIKSTALSAAEIARRLTCDDEESMTILINDEQWCRPKGIESFHRSQG